MHPCCILDRRRDLYSLQTGDMSTTLYVDYLMNYQLDGHVGSDSVDNPMVECSLYQIDIELRYAGKVLHEH